MTGKLITMEKVALVSGYYLIKKSDKSRHFISKSINLYHLEKAANKALTDTDFDYYIDYYHGLDIRGNERWSNTDLTDLFI